jgi:LemA protein
MKKGWIIVIALVVVVAIWAFSGYNSLVKKEEAVKTAWAQVENQYQRRSDLIPNLVNTVKGYAAHESATLESVVAARSRATQMTVDPENLTPEAVAQYQEAQGQVGAALGRLIMLQENYPDLKANQNFMELQAQLEGTENRISTERMRFNEATNAFNVSVRRFPTSIIASMFGFERLPLFEASEGSETAPVLQF